MKIVSFYHDIDGKTFYSDCANKLKKNCDDLVIEHLIVERNYGNNWIDNLRAKPLFIKEMLILLKEPFIFLDVDCEVLCLNFKIENDWGFVKRFDGMPCDFVHYVNYSPDNLSFTNHWIKEIEKCHEGSHAALQNIYTELNYFIIPDGYFKLYLAQTDSKSQYFNEKWKNKKGNNSDIT